MIAAWALVIILLQQPPEVVTFPSQGDCVAAREAVVYKLSETQKSSFAFSPEPYGAVSACVPVETVRRRA